MHILRTQYFAIEYPRHEMGHMGVKDGVQPLPLVSLSPFAIHALQYTHTHAM